MKATTSDFVVLSGSTRQTSEERWRMVFLLEHPQRNKHIVKILIYFDKLNLVANIYNVPWFMSMYSPVSRNVPVHFKLVLNPILRAKSVTNAALARIHILFKVAAILSLIVNESSKIVATVH